MEERLEQIIGEVAVLKRDNKGWDPLLIWEPDIVRALSALM